MCEEEVSNCDVNGASVGAATITSQGLDEALFDRRSQDANLHLAFT